MSDQDGKGSLVCVGVGMTLGSDLTPLSRSYIDQSDVVFTALSNGIVELWVAKMHRDVRSLQSHYQEGRSRLETYRRMVESILTEVRAGKRVCAAFYGHPGVFAVVAHRSIAQARAEGYVAHMEPGISAEDYLYADLGIDPGKVGCQHYEAGQLMLYRRTIDPSAYLVLWQVGVAGDRSFSRFSTPAPYRRLLVELLSKDYPLDHEVIVYVAATLPIESPRIQRMKLEELPEANLDMHVTLVVPPSKEMEPNVEMRERLAMLDATQFEVTGLPDTERLSFRALSPADEELYFSLYANERVMQFIPLPRTPADIAARFTRALESTRSPEFKQRVIVVTEKATARAVGILSIAPRQTEDDSAEGGVMLLPSAQARGYVPECLTALIGYAFSKFPLKSIYAQTQEGNVPITRHLAKLGFTTVEPVGRGQNDGLILWRLTRESMIDPTSAKA